MELKLTITTAIIGLIILFAYVLSINALAITLYNKEEETEPKETIESDGGAMVRIGIGEQVDVSVKRSRWYGTIYESYSNEKSIGILRLFGFLKLPTMVNGKNWWVFHFIALEMYLIITVISFILDLIFSKERRDENGNTLGY